MDQDVPRPCWLNQPTPTSVMKGPRVICSRINNFASWSKTKYIISHGIMMVPIIGHGLLIHIRSISIRKPYDVTHSRLTKRARYRFPLAALRNWNLATRWTFRATWTCFIIILTRSEHRVGCNQILNTDYYRSLYYLNIININLACLFHQEHEAAELTPNRIWK